MIYGIDSIKRLFDKDIPRLKFNIYSHRFYGEPKLSKPKELKGISQTASVEYIANKCRCQVFINGDDVWIKHNDYFSEVIPPEVHEIGMPLNYFAKKYMGKKRANKFIYEDAWGSIIARNQAWIILHGILKDIESGIFELDIINEIRRQQEIYHNFSEYELCCTDMERFWERLVKEVKHVGKKI